MSVKCLFCGLRSWENCKECRFSVKVDEETLRLVPSGLILKRDGSLLK